jgi:Galactoside-binding lectin.
MLHGEWGEEEREGQMVFKQGTEFTIDIYCQNEVFKVCDILHVVVIVVIIILIIIIMNF